MEYNSTVEISSILQNNIPIEFVVIKNNIYLILNKKEYPVQFEYNTFLFDRIGFSYFTINFFDTNRVCFNKKLTTCKKVISVPSFYYDNLVYYTTNTTTIEN